MDAEFLKEIWTTIVNFCMTSGVKVILTLIMLIIGFKIIKVVTKSLKKENKLKKVDPGVKSFLISFLNIGLKILLLIMAAGIVGIPMASVIAVLGSCGLALGLSLQGSLSNLAGGMMILIFKPFSIGDYIETAGESGVVSDIGIFYTKIKTVDNKVIVLPNGTVSNQVVTNVTESKTRRVDVEFTASYDNDVDKVKEVLGRVVLANDKVLSDPAVFVGVKAHGDNAIVYVVRAWCNSEDYWDVYFYLNEKVVEEFSKEGISIPYPQVDVHMK